MKSSFLLTWYLAMAINSTNSFIVYLITWLVEPDVTLPLNFVCITLVMMDTNVLDLAQGTVQQKGKQQ